MSGDMAKMGKVFAEDIKWHVPGRGALAKTYSGHEEFFGFLGKLMELSNGTFAVEPVSQLGDDAGGVYIDKITGERNGKKLNLTLLLRVHVANGRIIEGWDHFSDTYAWDEFWA